MKTRLKTSRKFKKASSSPVKARSVRAKQSATAGRVYDRVISAPPEDMRDLRALADSVTSRYRNVIDALSKL